MEPIKSLILIDAKVYTGKKWSALAFEYGKLFLRVPCLDMDVNVNANEIVFLQNKEHKGNHIKSSA